MSIGYFALRPIKLASDEAHSGTNTVRMANVLFLCLSKRASLSTVPLAMGDEMAETGLPEESFDHKLLMTFTRTRVPSLFTGTESDRFTRARIWAKPVGGGFSPVEGKTKANVLSTKMSSE
jgi:hypothetical protein